MQTSMTIYRPDGTQETQSVTLQEARGSVYLSAKKLMEPHIVDANLEHVAVLHDGRRHDMFVDEIGQIKDLPHNAAATAIYRNATLTHYPDTDPESLQDIKGVAILFHDIIWR